MSRMENRTGEHEMAVAIMRIVAGMPGGCATLDQLWDTIPNVVALTDEDWEESDSQAGQPKWRQIVRNINSNRHTEGNFIFEGYLEHLDGGGGGYCITDKGRRRLGDRGRP